MAEGRLVIRKLAQHRAVELPQKGLAYREPLRMCRERGNYAPGFSSSTRTAAVRAWSEGWHSMRSDLPATAAALVAGVSLTFTRWRLL